MHDARELASRTMDYLAIGREVVRVHSGLTKRQEVLLDRALEALAEVVRDAPHVRDIKS